MLMLHVQIELVDLPVHVEMVIVEMVFSAQV